MTLFEKIQDSFSTALNNCCDFAMETESKEYDTCTFNLNNLKTRYQKAKITPKKEGQFNTFWKLISTAAIAPFDDADQFDYFLVAVTSDLAIGYFLFLKSILLDKNGISTTLKELKRAFRIYPAWSIPKNKQAIASQKWQMHYFLN